MEKNHRECPHCRYDKQSVYEKEREGFGWGPVKYYSVICDRCKAQGPEMVTPDDAWIAWDDRGEGKMGLRFHRYGR